MSFGGESGLRKVGLGGIHPLTRRYAVRIVVIEVSELSSIKDYLFEMQELQADEWIRERLSDDSLDEDSDEYQELAEEYSNYQEHLREEAEWQAELQWLKDNGSSNIHSIFVSELDALRIMFDSNLNNPQKMAFLLHTNIVVKMSYAYAVTLLESYLGDTLRALISQDEQLLKNALRKFKVLKNVKLADVAETDLDIKSLVLRYVGDVLYHNIPNVIEMYEQVLGVKLEIDISKVIKITKLRHDIVHRNGRTIDGSTISIGAQDFTQAISDIKEFTGALQRAINDNQTA
ncbi:hypothetical protein [Vibrio vulnificus]|uniref:hypothetical protein n=1 Tax=Vibrio vulnificus TaxID=672 RepID=UPI0025540AB7|nr:hypothetical protein [Vibrio vulnificus]WIL72938.1 hypothetical protein QPX65_08130 [Vibrio vulnificus]